VRPYDRFIDPLQRRADRIAVQDEHTHVDDAVRQRIREIVLKHEREELIETALRLVWGTNSVYRNERLSCLRQIRLQARLRKA
jgi:hypothetical protein